MKKQYTDSTGIRSVLQSLRAKLDRKFRTEAERVDEMIAEDRSALSDLQTNKADKATTLKGYGITDALPSSTPYAKSSTVGGSAVSFETSVEESDRNLPVYFANPSSTEVTGIAAHNTDLSFNPSTGTLKVRKIEGTADRAKQFETPATIELTGDVTGRVSSDKDWILSTTISPGAVTEEKLADSAVSNNKLQNASITLGSQTVSLGEALRSLKDLDSVRAAVIQGSLEGVADRAKQFETPAIVELTGAITGVASSGKNWVLPTAISSSAVTEEKIADGAVSNNKLQNKSVTLGSKSISLGESLGSLEGLDSVQATIIRGSLEGRADRALADGNGNIISSTYITKQEHQGYEERIENIEEKIPAQASPSNPLVDKAYVADQINAVSAYYITATVDGGSFTSKAALLAATSQGELYFAGQLRVPTKNDYCFVNKDESHGNMAARYVYQGNGVWAYQYTISQIALTTAQQKALDSGVTEEYLATVTSHMQNKANPHSVTPEQLGLADVATSGNYNDLADARKLSRRVVGTGNAITDVDVDDHTISLTKGAVFLTEHPEIPINPPTVLSKVATTFSVVDSITRDRDGHLTDFNVTEVSLPAETSTATYAELIGIRVGADGVTYPNAGEAVRTQVNQIKSDLGNLRFSITENNLLHVERKE